jgi:hypothetical protein
MLKKAIRMANGKWQMGKRLGGEAGVALAATPYCPNTPPKGG